MNYSSLFEDELSWNGFENLGFNKREAIKGIRQGASYFHEMYRKAKHKKRWADKTPQYVFYLGTLWKIFQPDAKFLFIFRHPLDVAYSIWDRDWEFGNYSMDKLENACIYVKRSISEQVNFLKNHHDNCHLVYYDKLVNEPVKEINLICNFLDEPYDEKLINHHQQEHDFGTEDPISYGTKGFKGSFENWKAWDEENMERSLKILSETIQNLGYSKNSPFIKNPLLKFE